MDPTECPHEKFKCSVVVHKIEEKNKIVVDLSGTCAECGSRLIFPTLDRGISLDHARASIVKTTASLPAKLIGPVGNPRADVGQYREVD